MSVIQVTYYFLSSSSLDNDQIMMIHSRFFDLYNISCQKWKETKSSEGEWKPVKFSLKLIRVHETLNFSNSKFALITKLQLPLPFTRNNPKTATFIAYVRGTKKGERVSEGTSIVYYRFNNAALIPSYKHPR